MPRCHSKVEQDMTEDLAELLEIEKQNFGQVIIYAVLDANTQIGYSIYLSQCVPYFRPG